MYYDQYGLSINARQGFGGIIVGVGVVTLPWSLGGGGALIPVGLGLWIWGDIDSTDSADSHKEIIEELEKKREEQAEAANYLEDKDDENPEQCP